MRTYQTLLILPEFHIAQHFNLNIRYFLRFSQALANKPGGIEWARLFATRQDRISALCD